MAPLLRCVRRASTVRTRGIASAPWSHIVSANGRDAGAPRLIRHVVVCSLSHSAAAHSLADTLGLFRVSTLGKRSENLVKRHCNVCLSCVLLLATATSQHVLPGADISFLAYAFCCSFQIRFCVSCSISYFLSHPVLFLRKVSMFHVWCMHQVGPHLQNLQQRRFDDCWHIMMRAQTEKQCVVE
jgi:hypothetical protein